jgi:glycerol kinase
LDNVKGLRKKALKGDVCFGTIDSWLIWKLTGGRSHVTDTTNASRTLLFNIRDMRWDKELLKIFKVPAQVLPSVQNSGSIFGKTAASKVLPEGIPISGVLGDQQAALYGQGCFDPGNVKNTYGTGCFIMMNTGKKLVYSKKGLLSTVASDENGKPVYALEGAVFIAGAVMQWLRDELKIIKKAKDSETIVKDLKDTNGVYIVPAFTGLGAPYWDSEARGIICGLTRGANRKHLVRAALESICYQVKDVFDIMQQDINRKILSLNVDGGASKNPFLMQFQADILNTRIIRPQVIETTAQGAAFLAGRTAGLWKAKGQIRKLIRKDKTYSSRMPPAKRAVLYKGWQAAVERAKSS